MKKLIMEQLEVLALNNAWRHMLNVVCHMKYHSTYWKKQKAHENKSNHIIKNVIELMHIIILHYNIWPQRACNKIA